MLDRRQLLLSLLSGFGAATLPAAAGALQLPRLLLQARAHKDERANRKGDARDPALGSEFKVIGVGGAGGNVVEHMLTFDLLGVEYLFANTDEDSLCRSGAHRIFLLDRSAPRSTRSLGRYNEPGVLVPHEMRSALTGAHTLFIAAGLGGSAGTQAAPVIGRIARELGMRAVAVVNTPFSWEGTDRMSYARNGLVELESNVDLLVVLSNDKLVELVGANITHDEAIASMAKAIRTIMGFSSPAFDGLDGLASALKRYIAPIGEVRSNGSRADASRMRHDATPVP